MKRHLDPSRWVSFFWTKQARMDRFIYILFDELEKRVYGVASVRNDLVAPSIKKVMDRKNYGTDGNVWSIVSPSVFTQHGVYEKDVLKPRSKDELKTIFKNIGYELSASLFDSLWDTIQSKNPYGVVSVEEFRNALSQLKIKSEQNSQLVCN